MKSIALQFACEIFTIIMWLGSTTSLNYKDGNFSTTSANLYEVYAVDQVGHISTTPGTVTYTASGGGGGKPKRARAK